jgi:hypothetical protein
MKAILRQWGDIPPDSGNLYRNALAGAKVLCDLLAEKDFADVSTVTLDFEGDGFTPVVEIHTIKWVPRFSPANLQHIWPLDMTELFGQDNADNALLRQIVNDIEYAMRAEEEARDKIAVRKKRIEV